MSETVYNYWVSFSILRDGVMGVGSCRVGIDFKLNNSNAIAQVQDHLEKEEGYDSLVIINFIELDE